MTFNPMSADDYEAIYWLEDRSKELPALGNAWQILKKYYDECKKEIRQLSTLESPFADELERDNVYSDVQGIVKNEVFMEECSAFFGVPEEELLKIVNDKNNHSLMNEWVVAKIARLYNMHLKLGHSARITYIADRELQNIPENDILQRTVLLSALLHDVGRFYQSAHYNDLKDIYMRRKEEKIGDLEVDHAIAGYYYSLASALVFHKEEGLEDQSEILRYITEAIAAVVVKCHQKANNQLSYFDYDGTASLDSSQLIGELYPFVNYAYENAKLMNYDVSGKMNPRHKEFIDRFINKVKEILYRKELDYSVASGFEVDEHYANMVYTELQDEIHQVLSHTQGQQMANVSEQILDVMNCKIEELAHSPLEEAERKSLKEEIEESLRGMLDFDIASSIETIFQNQERVPNSVKYLLSNALSMTMDADKIDILNQRALGIYNKSYWLNALKVFPTKGSSLKDLLNNYFHFNLGEPIVVDEKVVRVLQRMNPQILSFLRDRFESLDLFDETAPLIISEDRAFIHGVEIDGRELYRMFHDDWSHYLAEGMSLDENNMKQKYLSLLTMSISRDDFEDNLKNCSEEEKREAYRRLLVSEGMKKRFMLEEKNGILAGWILDSEDSEHIDYSNVSGLLWQLNQFLLVNMRNKHSYEFIDHYHMLDQIYEQYEKKDPMIASILKEYIEYCKKFVKKVLEDCKGDMVTGEMLAEERRKVFEESTMQDIEEYEFV